MFYRYLNHRLNTRSTGSFSFQNAFFYLQWNDDAKVEELGDPISANLVTLKKTRRKTKLHPHKQRSKYICRPELVVEAGNHFVWEFIPGHGELLSKSGKNAEKILKIIEFMCTILSKNVQPVSKNMQKICIYRNNAM